MRRDNRTIIIVVLVFLAVVFATNGQWLNTGWAAGTSITAQSFGVTSVPETPGVALQDDFTGNGALNGRQVPFIDPDGGTTFGTLTTNRPFWTSTDAAWTTNNGRARHGNSGAPSLAHIPWLSRSSYVQVVIDQWGTRANAGVGILCTAANTCIAARLDYRLPYYYLDFGTLSAGAFTTATSPTCTSGSSCVVNLGTSVPTASLKLAYNAGTNVATMTFNASTLTMTVPTSYRNNTLAGLFALANNDATGFTTFQAGTQ